MKGMSDAIKQIPISGGESKKPYLYIDDEAGLFGLVQIGTLEIHDWGVSLDHLDEPDRLVFDLDPDEGLDLDMLKAAAVEVRDFLADLGLKSFLKSTGGKGLACRRADRAEARLGRGQGLRQGDCRCAGRGAARPLHRQPAQADAQRARSSSTICATSAAARPSSIIRRAPSQGAPVACPLGWDELKGLKAASPYTLKTLPARLKAKKTRPMGGIFLHPPVDHGKGQESARAWLILPVDQAYNAARAYLEGGFP